MAVNAPRDSSNELLSVCFLWPSASGWSESGCESSFPGGDGQSVYCTCQTLGKFAAITSPQVIPPTSGSPLHVYISSPHNARQVGWVKSDRSHPECQGGLLHVRPSQRTKANGRLPVPGGWVNQAYSRLSTTHGHITDCKSLCRDMRTVAGYVLSWFHLNCMKANPEFFVLRIVKFICLRGNNSTLTTHKFITL